MIQKYSVRIREICSDETIKHLFETGIEQFGKRKIQHEYLKDDKNIFVCRMAVEFKNTTEIVVLYIEQDCANLITWKEAVEKNIDKALLEIIKGPAYNKFPGYDKFKHIIES